ncbi:sacsin N-terminal ATP-binding-like domain-containing protein [Nocardia tengchongensis]|uniref:sacsin N-terminal ATP-binding-like domain-containing protein n=1 Tax=Nocardia tengchongensis TaxID=2055889 RepID=UPI0036B3B197
MSELAQHLAALQTRLVNEHKQAPGLFGEIARMEDLLADTYRNRVPYELLQNSDDAESTTITVTGLEDGTWSWSNNGRPLTSADAEALCRSASSTKRRGGDSIGYRGIGFKSLAAIASHIDVQSSGVTFTFDRSITTRLLGEQSPSGVPLIRIPCEIRSTDRIDGVTFTISGRGSTSTPLDAIDPTSLLFLRHVTRVNIGTPNRAMTIRVDRDGSRVTLHDQAGTANFGLLRHGTATVAVPLDPHAQSLTGLRGRLACGLPLDDEPGLPVAVSGDLLTDPSRTHAVVGDESTQQVLADAATAIAIELTTPKAPVFQRLWELILEGEDLRSLLVSSHATASSALITTLQRVMKARPKGFAYSPLPLTANDVTRIFQAGAPAALYTKKNQPSARALKTVLGLDTLDVQQLVNHPVVAHLSDELIAHLGAHLGEMARTYGRQLTTAEQHIVDRNPATLSRSPQILAQSAVEVAGRVEVSPTAEPLADIVSRWRTAELATMEYLNCRGWRLEDVSGQNVGYDLAGNNPAGEPVRIEVKKVDHMDARFAMTNNEMSLMLASPGGYLLAVLVGDGRYVKLVLVDPSNEGLPKERVCRRWDWEFTDWARFATVVE